MSAALALTLFVIISSLPVVQATTSPVELVMGGEGSSPWRASSIEPGDHGTEEVEVRNIGSSIGYLRIWISGIEGTDGGGDGAALAKYLRFGVAADGLSTSLSLPAPIGQFPNYPTHQRAVVVGPIGVGDGVVIEWSWEFAETGAPQNDAQGDGLSFDINYMLTDAPSPAVGYDYMVIDLLGWQTPVEVDDQGVVQHNIDAVDPTGVHHLRVPAGTTVLDGQGEVPGRIVMSVADHAALPNGPAGSARISPVYLLQGYSQEGAPVEIAFSQKPTLVMGVDASDLPAGHLPMGVYSNSGGEWDRLPALPVEASKWSASCLVDRTGELTVFSAPVLEGTSRLYTINAVITLDTNQVGMPLAISTTRGRSVSLSVDIVNPANTSGVFMVDLKLDGQVVDTRSVVLGPLEASQVIFRVDGLADGEHEVEVLGRAIGFVSGTAVTWLPLAMLNVGWVAMLLVVGRGTPGGLFPWGRRAKPAKPPRQREKLTHLEEMAQTTEIANPDLLGSMGEVWEGHRVLPPSNGKFNGKE